MGEIPMSIGNSNSYAFAENFLKILQGPIFFNFSLLYSLLGNILSLSVTILDPLLQTVPLSSSNLLIPCTYFFFPTTII